MRNADNYLAQNLPALLKSRYFQPGGDGVLIITFDESDLDGDDSCSEQVPQGCGGHIFFAIVGPNLKTRYQSSTHMMQNNMLRGTCDLLGISPCPGDGGAATGLTEFFTDISGPIVSILTPYDYYPNAGPATNVVATANSGYGQITEWAVYVDGKLYNMKKGAPSLQIWVATPMGLHLIGVNAWDGTGHVGVKNVHVTRTY